ncbi:MAG: hypothetical protein GX567_12560, partial [Clostridia bacterium]|nr:hypothetical protein [Clostridia bacterium]
SAKATEIVAIKINSITENTANIHDMLAEVSDASDRMKDSVSRFSKE